MKNILLALFLGLLFTLPSFGQQTLAPGDIMIVGFLGDGDGTPIPSPITDAPSANCGDGFYFINLVELDADVEIIFTEEEWIGTSFDDGGEGHVIWTNTSGNSIPVGTVVKVITNGQVEVESGYCGGAILSVALDDSPLGSAQFDDSGTDKWALSSSNEEIYVYQGTPGAPPYNWISAFFTDELTVNSFVPVDLANAGDFVVDLEPIDPDADIALYSGPTDCGDHASCVTLITNTDNWSTDNGPGFNSTSICDSPTDIATTLITNTTATITWNALNSGQEFEIEYKQTGSGNSFLNVIVNGPYETELSNLAPGRLYKYRIRRVCNLLLNSSTTGYSDFFFFNTTQDGCDIPTGVFVDLVDNTSARLNWTSANAGGTYEVQYKPSIAGQPFINVGTGTDKFLILTALTPGQQYKFQVRGICDLSGTIITTDYTPVQTFATTEVGCSTPSGLGSGVIDNTSAQILWIEETPGQTYFVEYKPTISGVPYSNLSVGTTSTTLTSLLPGQQYKIRVKGICDIGGAVVRSDFSPLYYFTTTQVGLCDIPSGLFESGVTDMAATLNWSDPLGQDYTVKYKPAIAGQPLQSIYVSGDNFTTIGSLLSNQQYKYKVRAICDIGGSTVTTSFSSFAFFTTDPAIPSTQIQNNERSQRETTEEQEELTVDNIGLEVYPNPSSDYVTINFSPDSDGQGNMMIYSINGGLIIERAFENSLHQTLSLKQNGSGIYLIRVIYNDRILDKKIIVK